MFHGKHEAILDGLRIDECQARTSHAIPLHQTFVEVAVFVIRLAVCGFCIPGHSFSMLNRFMQPIEF
jgi:hypothetical protein